jgi:aspartyl/asparaginyl beta-hydroxylase (cupin superfamily)
LAAVLAEAHARVLADAERLGAMLDRAIPDAPPRVAHARDHLLGRRAIFTHRPTGLHVPRLPADEFFDPELFPWFGELNAAAGAIRAEAEALLTNDGGAFGPYVAYKPGTPVAQWEELNHSLRWGAAFLWRHGAAVEAMHARCPATVAALRATPTLEIPGRGPTAFFSLLAPRTRIPAHTGVTNARAIVHLPLVVPEGCGFRVGSETRTWREGEAFAFDDSIEHEAWNDGDQQRLVLIFDVWNPHLAANERAALSAMWMALDAANPDGSLFD